MAIDGIFLHFLKNELKKNIIGCRIENINQTSKNELLLNLRDISGTKKLYLNCSGGLCRISITENPPETPKEPTMLTMLFRKKLRGGKITDIRQNGLDRILYIDFLCTNEIGNKINHIICCELISTASNIILTDENNKIIEALRHIKNESENSRDILPNIYYQKPKSQCKANIFTDDISYILNKIYKEENRDRRLSSILVAELEGLSPLISRELAFKAFGNTDILINQISLSKLEALLKDFKYILKNHNQKAYILFDKSNKPKDISYLNITQYGNFYSIKEITSFSFAMEYFFSEKTTIERTNQRSKNLNKIVKTLYERSIRKLKTQEKELSSTEKKEKIKLYAELITANQYALKNGMSFYEVLNYYDNTKINIPVDPSKTPQANAQLYFKKYKKLKTAENILKELIKSSTEECEYLLSVLDELKRAETYSDITEIRTELIKSGFLKQQRTKKNMKDKPQPPIQFKTSEGFYVFIGRNNLQNEELSLKKSNKLDMWFHIQKIPGSHTVLKYDGREFTDLAISEAAQLAAAHSSADFNIKVPVDYTLIKNLKKPQGSHPGKVIYHTYNTIYVKNNKKSTV